MKTYRIEFNTKKHLDLDEKLYQQFLLKRPGRTPDEVILYDNFDKETWKWVPHYGIKLSAITKIYEKT